VKLASELSRRSTGHTLYVLDEPTTGLHFDDVRKLLDVLSRLVDQGNTVIVIEHNLDVIKSADWIIDLGPEGGDGGGSIVAVGTPEEVAGVPTSYTGEVLAPLLGIERPGPGVAGRARAGKAAAADKPRAAKAATKANGKAATRAATNGSTTAKGASRAATNGSAKVKATTKVNGSAKVKAARAGTPPKAPAKAKATTG
jgi:excinuclease ABC subunit A